MPITHFHSYLIHPGKNIEVEDRRDISGAEIPLSGKLHEMFRTIYSESKSSCTHRVNFVTDDQSNPARDLIVPYAKGPTLNRGLKIAKRLQGFTTKTPGIGLLFLVRGEENGKIRTLLSRFPAEVGILAEEAKGGLNVEYLEKVFMKNAKKYKAAVYEDDSPDSKYWKGRVADHQISDGVRTVSDYWVIDFLASTSNTPSKEGSKRLGKTVKTALKNTSDPAVKRELVSVAQLVSNLHGTKVSPKTITKKYSLSSAATQAVKDAAKNDQLFNDEFKLDKAAYGAVLSFETRELDNGAILTCASGQFEDVFTEEVLDAATGLRIYSTEGKQIDVRLNRAKP